MIRISHRACLALFLLSLSLADVTIARQDCNAKTDHAVPVETLACMLIRGNATLTDANGNITSYIYDKANRRTSEQRPLNTTTITAYYPIGDVHVVTDADGNAQTSTYGNL